MPIITYTYKELCCLEESQTSTALRLMGSPQKFPQHTGGSRNLLAVAVNIDFIFIFSRSEYILLLILTPGACTLGTGEHDRKGKDGSRRADLFTGSL